MNYKFIPFNFYELQTETAWLLGFIFADSTIGFHLGNRIIRLFNKDKEFLERIVKYYHLPYKVTKQKRKDSLYLIRFSNPEFVDSVEFHGFKEDKSKLGVPQMNDDCAKAFIQGFIKGKGSSFEEESGQYGYKIVYRSENLIKDLANKIAYYCKVRVANPHCRFIKNETSCEIKYVSKECDRIKKFIDSEFSIPENESLRLIDTSSLSPYAYPRYLKKI